MYQVAEDWSFVRNIITTIVRTVIWLKIKTDFEGFLAKNKMIFKTFQTNNIYLAYVRVLAQNICLVWLGASGLDARDSHSAIV